MSALGAPNFAEDTAHSTGDRGIMPLAVANLTNAQRSGADGDYTPVASTLEGFVKAQPESTKATFAACLTTTTSFDATPTDFFAIRGSGSKTVKVLRIELHCAQTTIGDEEFFLVKRAANTSGTSSTLTKVPLDSAQSSHSDVEVRHYTADPTLGTPVGTIKSLYVTPGNLTPGTGVPHTVSFVLWDAHLFGCPIVLEGTAEWLAINFNGASLPSGARWGVNIIWTED